MNVTRVLDRANAIGAVGQYLKGLLDMEWAGVVMGLPYEEQISAVYRPVFSGQRVSDIERAAAAFLVPDYPVQVALSEGSLRLLVDNTACPRLPTLSEGNARWARHIGNTVKLFPLKRNPAAFNKVNVFLSEVLDDLRKMSPMSHLAACASLWEYRGKLFNDQASAVVLYGTGLAVTGVSNPYSLAAELIVNEPLAKAYTTFVKAVGANGSRLGSMLVETNTMRGRDVGVIDLAEEARYRTTSAVFDKIADFPEEDLRAACYRLLRDEISHGENGLLVDFPTYEEHWESRWAWAVNGAHSGHVSRNYARAPKPPGMLREHRRAWLESVDSDPRVGWDGHTYVSVSPKIESGKTRAIFACDTVSYLAFEHLLGPVERRWRHKNVILDPGKGGHVGMSFRTRAARNRSGVSMMLDYDDFNSQHSTRAMQILIEVLCDLTGYPRHLADVLIHSFDVSDIYYGAQYIGRALGTLMSGHRGTTFINSCLNRVYLDLVLGRDILDNAVALHVGDDVYFGVTTYKLAGTVCRLLSESKLRMNPIKQSVGHVSTEFLRNAASGRSTRGYLARGVAGVIAGNWTSDLTLSPAEAMSSIIAAGRTLANRSTLSTLPLLLFSSLCRMTGLPKEDHKKLKEILQGSTALDNGPQFHHGGYYRSVPLLVGVTATDRHGLTPLPHAATVAYLTRAASPLEVSVLTQSGVSVVSSMEEASFRKSLPARYKTYETVRLGGLRLTAAIGSESVANLVNVPPPRGVLQKYPLLTLARHRLSETLVRWAVGQAGGDPNSTDLEYEAWGEFKHGCIIASPLSYADAAMYGHRTRASVLTCPIDVYV